MTGTATLTPLECAAIRLASRQIEQAAKGLQPGRGQRIDLVLRLEGMLNRGEDGVSQRKTPPACQDMLAWLLSRMSVPARDKLMDDYVAHCQKHGAPSTEDADATARARQMADVGSTTQTFPRAGALTGSITLAVIDTTSLKPQAIRQLAECSRMISLEEGE